MAAEDHCIACRSRPPVSITYATKGEFIDVSGVRTYVTGPSDAKAALILVYDIFGFSPQIMQGADILSAPDSSSPYRVYMPDFLAGQLANPAWFPPETEEQKAAMGRYFGPEGPARAEKMVGQLMAVRNALEGDFEKFGVVGYCWGAKIAVLCSFEGSKFDVAIQAHPSGFDAADAPKVTIPMCILASQDEDAAVVKAFDEGLHVPKFVEIYGNAPHGWTTARGDLEDTGVREDYQRGYGAALRFFHAHL